MKGRIIGTEGGCILPKDDLKKWHAPTLPNYIETFSTKDVRKISEGIKRSVAGHVLPDFRTAESKMTPEAIPRIELFTSRLNNLAQLYKIEIQSSTRPTDKAIEKAIDGLHKSTVRTLKKLGLDPKDGRVGAIDKIPPLIVDELRMPAREIAKRDKTKDPSGFHNVDTVYHSIIERLFDLEEASRIALSIRRDGNTLYQAPQPVNQLIERLAALYQHAYQEPPQDGVSNASGVADSPFLHFCVAVLGKIGVEIGTDAVRSRYRNLLRKQANYSKRLVAPAVTGHSRKKENQNGHVTKKAKRR